ncbi:MAG: type II toxin-antitoxin system YhaV family toxin [Desulfobacteraceae bacterium]|nr:type II toxin-antitoxin system YhaV family toxin [Desulfobacteraceae bacterium]
MRINNWEIYAFKLFSVLYYKLVSEVKSLAENEPETYKQHPKSKLLKSINDAIFKDVPADPTHKDFNLGKTLGENYKQWKRVKKRMPPRYRMFFRYHSDFVIKKGFSPEKCIIFVWFNDESTLRKEGSKTDCYKVLAHYLNSGKIPNDWGELFAISKSLN